jgi:hypothetical protein
MEKNSLNQKSLLAMMVIAYPDKIENFINLMSQFKSENKINEFTCINHAIKEIFLEKNNNNKE